MNEQFGIYVHWPFCASKCPYCDFNSHVAETIDQKAWKQAYLKEIDYYAGLTPGRTVTSVFFGGGTPSLMEPEVTGAVIDRIGQCWGMVPDAEITLEANPTSVESSKFAGFRTAGVNRVSLGVQALNEPDLKFLGRQHDVRQALQAIDTAKKNFDRYSFDLIYARPNQNISAWKQELEEALQFVGGHLSVYQLTIEQGTPFYMRHARGEFSIPNEDYAGDFYEVTQDVLGAAGMEAYEVSNHAKPGQESQHNLAYWRYADYAGIGPGAHGRLTVGGEKLATRGHRAPDIWLKQVGETGHGSHPHDPVPERERFIEALMMGMRLREGLPYARLKKEGGPGWKENLDFAKISMLQNEGYLKNDPVSLTPTAKGLQALNRVLVEILK